METKPNYQLEVYKPNLEAALEFQDFICEQLHQKGTVLQMVSSKKYQLKHENLLGLEIKFDRNWQRTGNLYIETHEKADPSRQSFWPSGINRDDDCWLYGIGDYSKFWIFAKNTLQRIDTRSPTWIQRVERETHHGFLIPTKYASQLAARVLEFADSAAEPHRDAGKS